MSQYFNDIMISQLFKQVFIKYERFKITNNATNTTATSGDLEVTALGNSGSVIIELRKDENFTA